MYQMGIEIGGTKLQLAVGQAGETSFIEVVRHEIDRSLGAPSILGLLENEVPRLCQKYQISGVGVGFGGPVWSDQGIVQTSHQVRGWDHFPLGNWLHERSGCPVILANDCDTAGLAEARFGAGVGKSSMFFITVGTGIGGGLILNGRIHGTSRPAAAEIGHLRPGLDACSPSQTIEALAAGPAISEFTARQLRVLTETETLSSDAREILDSCEGDLDRLTTRLLGIHAGNGNSIALRAFAEAAHALGWGIAQMITLIAPERVVIGGGVSLTKPHVFLEPLAKFTETYVFGQLKDSYDIVPAALGETVVLHGALALAQNA
ncbi:ROK family protein [Planctopirus limnophila DSM 3776]|uniref:ROK family protein n=1 Tax=Planctopirus limnophila (strain ATCC 43296 / DSM 3776 / IFAM 1008 / Mu 290) TaxID=521674 RepID=D5SVF2_PLAL2|nr:ROK family protein [Planctopirus limnophila]ADG67222.1 ROK family protein [Planctopirus limnophila DSM 3776]